jgi:molecular chaperone GrpE
MFQVPDPTAPAGTVVQVVQPGYMMGERILRPAMVGVSAGGPKAPSPTNTSKPQPGGEIAPANDNA